jgi:cytochrome b subunit of formate dehydrogenase
MLLPIDPVEIIMVATIAIVGVIMWRTVTGPAGAVTSPEATPAQSSASRFLAAATAFMVAR